MSRGWLGMLAVVAAALPAAARAANPSFPGAPGQSPRTHAPDDPFFDRCEADDAAGAVCGDPFAQEWPRFGFAPSGTQLTAVYAHPSDWQRRQNTLAGRNPAAQISGLSADYAWQYTLGDPDVAAAVIDSGIQWRRESLRLKVRLNRGELPVPRHDRQAPVSDAAQTKPCGAYVDAYDANGDGAFDVRDYVCDARAGPSAGHNADPAVLDAEDLIVSFSDRRDGDRNGYPDDIAGWDFFDADNDPYDASSYLKSTEHGSNRAQEIGQQTNDGAGGTGICPRCQVLPLRASDTFVVDTNRFAQGVVYAADNGVPVVTGAVAGLYNSSFARRAFAYAHRKGVLPVIVSSDLNTANHNYPTNYAEALMVQGTVADTIGLNQSLGTPLGALLGRLGIPSSVPVGTWFRNSGFTQYGGHAHLAMPFQHGSGATGQGSGAAALVISYARQHGIDLAPNEVKQILAMTAEDVLAQDTEGLGTPDPAQPGWDQHFGYGRPNLALAIRAIADGHIPPQAFLSSPEWFAPLDVARTPRIAVKGWMSAVRAGDYTWKLQWAPGIEPLDGDFTDVQQGIGTAPASGVLGTIDLGEVRAALDARPGGGAATDPTAPAKGPGDVDPNEPAFTVRLVVTDDGGNRGEDRRVLFAYRDRTAHPGWSQRVGVGGESSIRLFDVDGDNRLDAIEGASDGWLRVVAANGRPVRAFNRGRPVRTRRYPGVRLRAPGIRVLGAPREPLHTPAIGDIDGDREAEVVDTAGEHIYAWNLDGSRVRGFPVRVDPALSAPALRTRTNHIQRGFFASPSLGDLDGDGRLEIVAPSLDQHVYAVDGRGRALPGFPRRLASTGTGGKPLDGTPIVNAAAIGDIAGDARPEIVVPTNEVDPRAELPSLPGGSPYSPGPDRPEGFGGIVGATAGTGRLYALDGRGRLVPGWPMRPPIAIDAAPVFATPGMDHVLGDLDADPKLEVVGNAGTGDVEADDGDGRTLVTYESRPTTGEIVDRLGIINWFEYPALGNLDGRPGLEVVKGGVSYSQMVVNVGLFWGQNFPYNHVLQAWDGRTGQSLPAFPQAVEDYQLFSSPAIADVSDAGGAEAIVGTGLYLLRDINASGQEGHGWPKFTGGWLFGVPAIGDADGDGKLEVAAWTREGTAFLWDTDRPACAGNDEWWTFRHDERSTGAYGTDARPPGAARSLRARAVRAGLRLSWVAAGDDWLCGKADRVRVVASRRPVRHLRGATLVGAFDVRAAAGDVERRVLRGRRALRAARYVGVAFRDEAGNWGLPASVRVRR